jgi:hypothetical protein
MRECCRNEDKPFALFAVPETHLFASHRSSDTSDTFQSSAFSSFGWPDQPCSPSLRHFAFVAPWANCISTLLVGPALVNWSRIVIQTLDVHFMKLVSTAHKRNADPAQLYQRNSKLFAYELCASVIKVLDQFVSWALTAYIYVRNVCPGLSRVRPPVSKYLPRTYHIASSSGLVLRKRIGSPY